MPRRSRVSALTSLLGGDADHVDDAWLVVVYAKATFDDEGLAWSSSLSGPLRREPLVRDFLLLLQAADDDFPRRPSSRKQFSPVLRFLGVPPRCSDVVQRGSQERLHYEVALQGLPCRHALEDRRSRWPRGAITARDRAVAIPRA